MKLLILITGQLGLEDGEKRGDDIDEMGENLPYVHTFSCALFLRKFLHCFTLNSVKFYVLERFGKCHILRFLPL